MNLERQTAIALKWNSVAKLLGQSVSWVVTLIVIRLLAPEDYGLMAISAVIVSVLTGIAELGLGASLVQSRDLDRHELARVSGAIILLNAVGTVLIVLGAPFVADMFDDSKLSNVLRVVAAQLLFNAFASIPQAFAHREMRFKWLAGIELASGLLASVTTIVLALLGQGVWALVFGNLAGSAARTVLLLRGGTFVRPRFDFLGIGRHLRFGGAWSGATLAWQLTYQADILIAGRYLAEQAVGVYSVAVHLANLPAQKAMSVLNQVAFPAIARLQDELPRMRTRLLDALRLLGVATVPLLWGISAVAPEFVHVILGEQWREVVFPLQAIAIVAPLRMIASIFATAMSGIGRADVELRNTLVTVVVFPAAIFCGVHWGLDGLATGYALSVPLTFAINFPRTSATLRITGMQIASALRPALLAGAAMLTAVHGSRLLLADLSDLLRLIVLVLIGAAVYLSLVSLLARGMWTEVRRIAAASRE